MPIRTSPTHFLSNFEKNTAGESLTPMSIITLLLIASLEYYSTSAFLALFKKPGKTFKSIALLVYSALSLFAWICLLFFRQWNIMDWPSGIRVVVIAFVMGLLSAKIIVTLFMLLGDIKRLFTWAAYKIMGKKEARPVETLAPGNTPRGISRSRFLSQTAWFAGGLMLTGFMYGTQNRYRYAFKRYTIAFRRLPRAFKGLKIVQISDIHSGSFDDPRAVAQGVDMILSEKPDLILFTGDLVNSLAKEIEPYKEIFARLQAPMGVYSVLGNHDYGDYAQWPDAGAKADNLEDLKRHQKEMGWKLLMNEHVVFEKDGEKLALIGVENWSNLPQFPKHGDLAKAMEGLDPECGARILMSHDPTHWDAEVRPRFGDIDLTLSGHTHGMQFGIRLPKFQWSPVKFIYKQWAGLYKDKDQYLNVNVGYGFLGYPGRVGILPEISVIELH